MRNERLLRMATLMVAFYGLCVSSAFAGESSQFKLSSLDVSLAADGLDEEEAASTTMETTTTETTHFEWVKEAKAAVWPGFLVGMDGFGQFIEPVGMPFYFEDPFIKSDMRLVYIYHKIPGSSQLRGGKVQHVAAQIRVALTERLQFIAYKDGYSWVDAKILPESEGWNDIGIGLKYALYADPDEEYILSGGLKWELENGDIDTLHGSTQELVPFISAAKGYEGFNFMGTISGRIPTDDDLASYGLVWNLHADYKVCDWFYPLVEVHGIHWFSDGERLPLNIDYLDVSSIGSQVDGRDFFSAGLGFRIEPCDWFSFGATYEFPLEEKSENIQDYRFTVNSVIRF